MKIIGYEKEKTFLSELMDMLLETEEYLEKGIRTPKGAILFGKPGVGKTRLIKEMIKDGINLVELKALDVAVDNCTEIIASAFKKAKEKSPAVLFIDEIDKVIGSSEYPLDENSEANTILLQELDSVKPSDKLLVIAACTSKNALCEELLRPGRFDRIIQIDIPDYDTRKKIIEAYLNNLKIEKDIDLDVMTKLTARETGAEIERLVNEIGIYALNNKINKITIENVKTVLNKITLEGDEKSCLKEEEEYRIAVHEVGHTIIALKNDPELVFGVSVIPQGKSGGHTLCPVDEKVGLLASELENVIKIAIGGHVAERLMLGEYSLGAQCDLNSAIKMLVHLCKAGCYGYEYIEKPLGTSILSNIEEKDLIARKINERLYELDHEVEEYIKSNMDEFNEIIDCLKKEKSLDRVTLLDIHKKYQGE